MTTTDVHLTTQTRPHAPSAPEGGGRLLHQPIPRHVAELLIELQSVGLRVEARLETRRGGAGPTASGMPWIEGVAVTVPTESAQARVSPYALKWEDAGYGIYRDG